MRLQLRGFYTCESPLLTFTISNGHTSAIGVVAGASVSQLAATFTYLSEDRPLSVPAIKGYMTVLNVIFVLRRKKLSPGLGICLLFQRFEQFNLPRECRPPAWDLTHVLNILTGASCEPL